MKPLALLASAVLPAIATTTTAIAITPALAAPPPAQRPQPLLRPQTVAPLPGGLDQVLVVNDNNPELITGAGILLSTFPGSSRPHPAAHLDVPLNGRFDLFSHHRGWHPTWGTVPALALDAAPKRSADLCRPRQPGRH